MRHLLTLLAFLLLVPLFAVQAAEGDPSATAPPETSPDAPRITVRPHDNGAALVNPDMGWTLMFYSNVPHNYGSKLEPSDTVDDWPGLSTVYLRIPWAFVEPEEGRFNWAVLDTPAQRWIAKGKRVAFRLTCSENWLPFATPEWVKNAGAQGVFYTWGKGPDPQGKLWDPVFDDPIFLAKLEAFLQALAARYDGNPDVAFLDIGSYGMWGEGHTGGSSRVPQEKANEIVRTHIDLYLRCFPRTRLAILDDVAGPDCADGPQPLIDYARVKGISLRDDSICVQPPPRSWFHAQMAQPFWPEVPVIVEHEHYGPSQARGAWGDGSLLTRAVEEYHASYLTIHWWPREMLSETQATVAAINRRLGYRLQLRELSWPAQAVIGKPFAVDATWANAGVAPCYPGGFAGLTLKDDQGGIAAVLVDEGFDVRSLETGPPDQAPVVARRCELTAGGIAPATRPGRYQVFVSVGRRDGTPVFELPLDNGDGQRRYRVGTIELVAPEAGGPVGSVPPPAQPAATPWKLLFSGRQDLADPWGQLEFGVTPVKLIRECEPPGFTAIGGFPLADGAWQVFGQQMTEISRGSEPYERVTAWKLVRATTRDGVTFEGLETVFEPEPAAWTDHAAIAFNPDAHEYLLLKLKVDRAGFAYTAFFSPDGKQWQAHAANPLFYEGDALSLFWSPVRHRFVCVSKSLQPYRKRILDHGGPTPALGDDALRDRRVLMMRSSPDGRTWAPSVSLSDVWNRHERKGAIPAELLTKPDADDPPDLEFYSGNGFWYHDRAYMTVLNYAASPLALRKHGPQLDNEWWTSRDGLRWERPARGVNALDVFPQIPRLETHPLIVNGTILFLRGQLLLGLPEDRISYLSARANGEFSTRPFAMPAGDLLLNAAVPAPERLFAKDQAYVMVAVLDEAGNVIPGFEAEKCVIRNEDRRDIPLRWGEASASQLAGQTVRLRVYLRSANLYAVTAADKTSVAAGGDPTWNGQGTLWSAKIPFMDLELSVLAAFGQSRLKPGMGGVELGLQVGRVATGLAVPDLRVLR